MAFPRSSEAPRPEAPLLIGQSLELWRGPIAGARDRGEALRELDRLAAGQLALGAGALDLNAGAGAGQRESFLAGASHLAGAWPEVPLFLDCGDPGVLASALRRASEAAPSRPAPLVANSLSAGGGDAEPVLHEAVRAGAGVVISPQAADGGTAAAPARALLALCESAARSSGEAGVRGPLYADALAHPPALDAARCRRSLELLRALRGSRWPLRPLVAVGNVGHGAPVALRPALRRLYAAAAIGSGARALILPVEDEALVASVAAITVGGVDQRLRRGKPAAELPWLRRVVRIAAAGEELPDPPARAGRRPLGAWKLMKST